MESFFKILDQNSRPPLFYEFGHGSFPYGERGGSAIRRFHNSESERFSESGRMYIAFGFADKFDFLLHPQLSQVFDERISEMRPYLFFKIRIS